MSPGWDGGSRFAVIRSNDSVNFSKVSIILISRLLKSDFGEVKTLKKLKDGQLLIEVSNEKDLNTLLQLNKLGNFNISVSPHKALNQSKGIIRFWELEHSTEEEIKSELQDQYVIDAKKISKIASTNSKTQPSFLLTFSIPTPPEFIKIAFQKIPVKLFIPRPLRCFRCFAFNHHMSACKRKQICYKCGNEKHDGECLSKIKCINCSDEHYSSSKKCPIYIKEQKIKEIQTKERIPYNAARTKTESSTTPTITFSAVTKGLSCTAKPHKTDEDALQEIKKYLIYISEYLLKLNVYHGQKGHPSNLNTQPMTNMNIPTTDNPDSTPTPEVTIVIDSEINNTNNVSVIDSEITNIDTDSTHKQETHPNSKKYRNKSPLTTSRRILKTTEPITENNNKISNGNQPKTQRKTANKCQK